MKYKNNKEIEVKKLSCPKCNSESLKKRGFRKTQNRGKIQRYECKKCKNSFVQDLGF